MRAASIGRPVAALAAGAGVAFCRSGGFPRSACSTTTRGSWAFLVSFLVYFFLMHRLDAVAQPAD